MGESKRGILLTVIAILFGILAISDIIKPLTENAQTGLVFLGVRQHGLADATLGPALGIVLLLYAAGIWRMRRYALYLGTGYAVYVILNLILFTRLNPPPATSNDRLFGIVYMIVAITMTVGTVLILRRRRTDLG